MAYKDIDILEGLRHGDRKILGEVYSQFRVEFIQWITTAYSCDVEEARDIYQQSIVILYENVVEGKLTTLTSSLKTYLFSIGKNKFKEYLRKSNRQVPSLDEDLSEDKQELESRLNLIESGLGQLGEPCRSLLIQFYYHRQSIDQLCEQFGYKNAQSAKNQKYKCLERLRRLVMKQSDVLSTDAL